MRKNLLILFASAAVLTACGGGDDAAPAPAPVPAPAPAPAPAPGPSATVPDSAAASVQSFFDYIASLLSSSSETATPLSISAGFNAAVSDTESPKPIP